MHPSWRWTIGLVVVGAVTALAVAVVFDSPTSVLVLAVFALATALASILTWQRQRGR
jgi:hypothetical protein